MSASEKKSSFLRNHSAKMYPKLQHHLLPTLILFLSINLGLVLANPSDIINRPNQIGEVRTSGNEVNWEISKDICLEVTSCTCNQPATIVYISCRCEDETQIVNLRRSTDKHKFFQVESSWTIEKCGRIVVQPKAFSAVNGEYFDLRLMNLSSVEINEEAFELTSGKKQETRRKVSFEQVNIERLPQKSFPSKLNVIQFTNSNIRTISNHAFVANSFNQIIFMETTVGTIESGAFSESLLIDSWLVRKSNFKSIKSQGVASSVTNMTWIESKLDHLESFALSGDVIANASFRGNEIGIVETNGLTLKEWTWISYVNNTFTLVNYSGIDLSKHSSTNFNVTEFSGNTWIELQPDFIIAGRTESILAIVRNNRLQETCVCGKETFSKLLSRKESSSWFHDEFRNNSKCYTTWKVAECIGLTSSDPEDPEGKVFIPYSDWELTCNDTGMNTCLNEVIEHRSVYSTPTSPSRLRLLVILIGSVGIAIVICLVGVVLVYLCRRSHPSPKSSPSNSSCATHPGELAKSLAKGSSMSYADIVNKSSTPSSMMSNGSNGLNLSSRPRSTIFEDVEMEDKGVQTMPSELSTDVLEGLRAKLSHPDSFWDAKETIDHLYDLIHVRETSPLSSPPDVTMLGNGNPSSVKGATTLTSQLNSGKVPNTKSTSTSTSTSPADAKLLRPRLLPPRYAQIRSKPKTAPICEYGEPFGSPSDSQIHIYSELSPNQTNNNRQSTASTATQAYLCDYTEPKDVQTHVYAELNSDTPSPQQRPPMTQDQNRSFFSPPATSTTGQTQRFDYPNPNLLTPKNSAQIQTQILDTPCPSTPPCQQRPLPSIPYLSNVQ